MFATMNMADLDNWLIAHMREGIVGLEGEELAKAEAVVSANEAYLAQQPRPITLTDCWRGALRRACDD